MNVHENEKSDLRNEARWQVHRWLGKDIDYKNLKGEDLKNYNINLAIYVHVAMRNDNVHTQTGDRYRTYDDLLIDHWEAYLNGEIEILPLDADDPLRGPLGDMMVKGDYEYFRRVFDFMFVK